jgi:hypothetical protein
MPGTWRVRRNSALYGQLDDLLTLGCEVLIPAAASVFEIERAVPSSKFSARGRRECDGMSLYFPPKKRTRVSRFSLSWCPTYRS